MLLWLYKSVKTATYFHCLESLYGIPVSYFRKFEKLTEKKLKLQLDLAYFEKCIFLKVVPKFLTIKVPKLKSLSQIADNCDRLVVEAQIKYVQKMIKHNTKQIDDITCKIKDQLSWFRLVVLKLIVIRSIQPKLKEVENKHNDKLKRLWLNNRIKSPDCLVNLSNYELTLKEREVLRFGLKHSVIPKNICNDKIKYQLEKAIAVNIKNENEFNLTPVVKREIQEAATHFFKAGKKICNDKYNRETHKVLEKLAKRKDIKVCSFDKGNGLVIVNSFEYNKKMSDILKDVTKFQKIEYDEDDIRKHPTVTEEGRLYRYIYKYLRRYIDEKTYKFISPSGSEPGRLYGTVKVHKDNKPMRPIISTIGSASYNLAKFLDNLIKPHINSKHMLNSTSHLIEEINKNQELFHDKHILISYDVESLFTNIPVNETIELAANLVYDKNSTNKPLFGRDVFKKLCLFATSGQFLFNDQMFKQIDGVSMGSPLAPTLANLFLSHMEQNWMNEECSPLYYARYVDDCICVFDDIKKVERFHQFLNRQHKNLKFTVDIGGNSIAFLDVKINITNNLETSIFRKETFTNVLLNFEANCPRAWHRGLVIGMLSRAYTVASNWNIFHDEIEKILKIFECNGYTKNFVLKIVSDSEI